MSTAAAAAAAAGPCPENFVVDYGSSSLQGEELVNKYIAHYDYECCLGDSGEACCCEDGEACPGVASGGRCSGGTNPGCDEPPDDVVGGGVRVTDWREETVIKDVL